VEFLEKIINNINNFKNIKLIHLSSLQLSEINNNTDYVKTKKIGECLISEKMNSFNTYKILRLCNVFGKKYIKPYENSFINTLIYEKEHNINKIYEIINNHIYILNVNILKNLIFDLLTYNDNKIHNIISQKTNLFDIISYLFDKKHIQKYFTFVEGDSKNVIKCNNIVINNGITSEYN